MYKRRCEAPSTHVYYIPKKGQSLQYEYTQHEYIYREDVKLPLHISNKYQNILIPNYDANWNKQTFLRYQKILIENIL